MFIDTTIELSEYSKIEDNLRYFEVVIYTWYTSDIQVVYTLYLLFGMILSIFHPLNLCKILAEYECNA